MLRDLFAVAELMQTCAPVAIAAIASRTRLKETTINRIAACLTQRGFVRRRGYALTLIEPARVMQTWIAAWDGQRQLVWSFHVGLAWEVLVPARTVAWQELDWAWTGAAGAALLGPIGTPMQRVCYVAARHLAVALDRLARSVPALPMRDIGEQGTVHVVVPVGERAQLDYGRREGSGGAPVVSTVQVMLDLQRGPGGRERRSVVEAARCAMWRALGLGDAPPLDEQAGAV